MLTYPPGNLFQEKIKKSGGEEPWNLKCAAGSKFGIDERKCSFTQQGASLQNALWRRYSWKRKQDPQTGRDILDN